MVNLAENVWELHMEFCDEMEKMLKEYLEASTGIKGRVEDQKEAMTIQEKNMNLEDSIESTDEEVQAVVELRLKTEGPQERLNKAFKSLIEVVSRGS